MTEDPRLAIIANAIGTRFPFPNVLAADILVALTALSRAQSEQARREREELVAFVRFADTTITAALKAKLPKGHYEMPAGVIMMALAEAVGLTSVRTTARALLARIDGGGE